MDGEGELVERRPLHLGGHVLLQGREPEEEERRRRREEMEEEEEE